MSIINLTVLRRFGAVALLSLLAACGDIIPDSGAGVSDPSANFEPDTPEYFVATIGDRVHFDVDQSTLNPAARAILDAQAGWLTEYADYTALIEGHADEQGTREYNLALGARRAAAVKEYLVSRGIAADRLRTVTYGKERPIEVCSNESCWSQNRRAVTVLDGTGNI